MTSLIRGAAWLLACTVGVRIDHQAEEEGLDLSEHGERGYND